MNFSPIRTIIPISGVILVLISLNTCLDYSTNNSDYQPRHLDTPEILSAEYIDSIGYVELSVKHIPDTTIYVQIRYSNDSTEYASSTRKLYETELRDSIGIARIHYPCFYNVKNFYKAKITSDYLDSDWSEPFPVMVGAPPIPDPVKDLYGYAIPDSHTIRLSLTTHGEFPKNFEVEHRTENGTWKRIFAPGIRLNLWYDRIEPDSIFARHTMCAYRTTNYYRVRTSKIEEYYSDYSNILAVVVEDPPLFEPPDDLEVFYVDTVQSVRVEWCTEGASFNKYQVEHRTNLAEWRLLFEGNRDSPDSKNWLCVYGYWDKVCGIHISSQFNETNYYRVRVAKIYDYYSYFSNVASIQVGDPPSIPIPPSDLTTSMWGAHGKLTWKDNSDNEIGFVVEDSIVHSSISAPAWQQIQYISRNCTTTTVTNSEYSPSAYYFFRVSAVNRGGQSETSEISALEINKFTSGGGGGGGWGGCGLMISDPTLDRGGNKEDLNQTELVMWSKHHGYAHINDRHRISSANISAGDAGVFAMDGRGECFEEMKIVRTLKDNILQLDLHVRSLPVDGQESDHDLGIGFLSESAILWGEKFTRDKTIDFRSHRVNPPFGDRIELVFEQWYHVKIKINLSEREYAIRVDDFDLCQGIPLDEVVVIPCRLCE